MGTRKQVIVHFAPISSRYWYVGCVGVVNGDVIRVGGAWFDLDYRWDITDKKEETKKKDYNDTGSIPKTV